VRQIPDRASESVVFRSWLRAGAVFSAVPVLDDCTRSELFAFPSIFRDSQANADLSRCR